MPFLKGMAGTWRAEEEDDMKSLQAETCWEREAAAKAEEGEDVVIEEGRNAFVVRVK